MKLKTNQKTNTITINLSEFGLKYEIIPTILFPKLQETIGIDLKSVFVKYFQTRIADLEQAEKEDDLTEIGKTKLANYKDVEQILANC